MTPQRRWQFASVLVAALVLAKAQPCLAQGAAGDWQGTLKSGVELRLVLHITAGPSGLTGTMDSPDQGARGIPLTAVALTGTVLTFSMPVASGSFTGTVSSADQITGTWTQGGQALPLVLTRVTDLAALEPKRPQLPKPPYPYREENVSYPSAAGVTLAATLTVPSGPGPFPAVVLITGSGPQDRDETLLGHKTFKVLADHLTRRGIAVLRADDRGTGASTGTFSAATTADFAIDAEAGLTFLSARKDIDTRKLGLVGHSEGGVVAPMIAARNPAVAFIVLMAGSGVPGDQLLVDQSLAIATASGAPAEAVQRAVGPLRQALDLVKAEKDDAILADKLRDPLKQLLPPAQIDARIRSLLSPWYRYFLAYDPAPALRRVRCPVLAIGGDKDLQVPSAANLAAIRAALKAGGNTSSQVQEMPGLNHLFQHATTGLPGEYARIEETLSPEVLELVAGWVLKQ
jgi:pimeloyl-ACP methyl ester carboxylesterase